MRCSKAQTMIILKLDQELKARYSTPLEKHLTACSACRLYREEMSSLNVQGRSISTPEFPSWIHNRILAQAIEHEPGRKHSRMLVQMQKVPALLAIMLSLYIGTLVGIKTHDSLTASETAYNNTTEDTTVASFGENSLVDESYYNGGSNE